MLTIVKQVHHNLEIPKSSINPVSTLAKLIDILIDVARQWVVFVISKLSYYGVFNCYKSIVNFF